MEKRQGTVSIVVHGSANRVWKEARDFSGIKRWLPVIDSLQTVEGLPNTVGCVRFAVAGVKWFKERLLALDDANMSCRYCIFDDNVGIEYYETSLSVSSLKDADTEQDSNCTVTWMFELQPRGDVDPFEPLSLLCSLFCQMAQGLENLVKSSSSS